MDAEFDPDGVTLRFTGPDGAEQRARVAGGGGRLRARRPAGPPDRRLRERRDAAARRGARPVRGHPAGRGPRRGRHPRAHAPGRGLGLADPDLGDGDERGGGGAPGPPSARVAGDRGGEPRSLPGQTPAAPALLRAGAPRVARALRRRLLLPRAADGRGSLGRGGRRGRVPRPDLLHRRAARHAGRARGGGGDRRRAPGGRSLGQRASTRYERVVRRRYHYFRRFVVGFYDPYFRRLLFRRSRRLGIYEAVLSALAGNWRPTPRHAAPHPALLRRSWR